MAKVSKKQFVIVGFILCILISLNVIFVTPNFIKNKYLTESIVQTNDINISYETDNVIDSIEKELNSRDTTIIDTLYSQINYYSELLESSRNKNRQEILDKIEIIANTIKHFEKTATDNNDSISLLSDGDSETTKCGLASNCICTEENFKTNSPCKNCIEYVNLGVEVVSIAALFEVRGWFLAADLMLHNVSNKILDSEYWPARGYTIAEAPQIKDMAQLNDLTGGFNQQSPGKYNGLLENTLEGDVYNALGAFYYSKHYIENNSENNKINKHIISVDIIDRYDYAPKKYGESLGDSLVAVLYKAQEIGVTTPYYTRINLTMPGNVPFKWRYCDDGVEILGITENIDSVEIPESIVDLSIKPKDQEQPAKAFITKIGVNAFKGKEGIQTVIFSENVNTICEAAFSGCTSLESISNLNNVENIGDEAFKNCSKLVTIDNLNNTTYIGSSAFENCTNLKSISNLNNITHIGDKAFKNCIQLTSFSNLNNLEFIGIEAFYNCYNLTFMHISEDVEYIGENAFGKCNDLNISVNSRNQYYCSENNILYDKSKTSIIGSGKIEPSIIIPESVSHINSYAFADNSNLENVHFYHSILIGINAFANCTNLQSVYFYSADLPNLGTNAFANNNFSLYVPFNRQSDYAKAFAKYTNKIDSMQVEVEFRNENKVIDNKKIYYGSVIENASLPIKEGHTFEGWYDVNGEKYVDKYGNGVKLVDKTNKIVLESHWAIKSYYIKLNGNGYVTWLGPKGISNVKCDIEYGTIISAINLIAEFKATKQGYKEGQIFDHFEYQNNTINWSSIPDLGDDGLIIEITPVWINEIHTIYFKTSTDVSINELKQEYGKSISLPLGIKRKGYSFAGWYNNPNFTGTKIEWVTMPDLTPKNNNNTYSEAQSNGSVQLYAKWIEIRYTVKYNANGGTGSMSSSTHYYTTEKALSANKFTRTGYDFIGWSLTSNGAKKFDDKAVVKELTEQSSITLYACWKAKTFRLQFFAAEEVASDNWSMIQDDYFKEKVLSFGESFSMAAMEIQGYTFSRWDRSVPMSSSVSGNTITITFDKVPVAYDGYPIVALYKKNCVAEGTLITLADGRQVPVETLTGEEQLLTWNMYTGKFESAPILFIDSDDKTNCEVINLEFSDGTIVKVISEHGFWDFDLNEYVFLRNDAAKYIGHWFNKQIIDSNGNMAWTKVQLTNVEIREEITATYSPVTYSHLCYYVNGMLSMPGATEGLINIFEVDRETMKINEDAMQADIEKYGLYTYEEFAEIMPIPEEVFNAFNGQYLKVSIGKGLISIEELMELFERYADFLS